MSLALCDPHGMFVDALAVALADRGHEIAGTVSDVGRISELVDHWSPTVCVLGLGVQEAEALAAAEAIRSGHPEMAIVLLCGGGSAGAWTALDAGTVNAIVDKRCDIATLDKTIHRAGEGESVVEGCSRPVGARSGPSPLDYLTDRERDVLRLIVAGLSTQRMSATLGVSTNTVRTHVQHVLAKLGVDRRSKAIRVAVELGLTDAPGAR